MKNITLLTKPKVLHNLVEAINTQYDVEILHWFRNTFVHSVLTQYQANRHLTPKQIQGLVNISNGIISYKNKDSLPNHYPNTTYNDSNEEGYWDDLGSMGYLN